MAVHEGKPATAWTVLAIIALIVSAFFYLVAQSSIAGLGNSDPAGNALSRGFASIGELMLWLFLAGFFLMCALRGRPPVAMLVVGVVTLGLGAIASMTALGLMERPSWIRITPTLMPPLVAAFAAWMGFSAEVEPKIRALSAWAFALIAAPLLVLPFYEYQLWLAAAPERAAERQRQQAEYDRGVEEMRVAHEAAFAALGPDSRLEDFFPYLDDTEKGAHALAVLHTARSRNADAIRMLDSNLDHFEMRRMSEFDLDPTGGLCASYRGFIDRRLDDFHPANDNWQWVPLEMESQLPNMRWFIAGDCDLLPQARRIAAQLRAIGPQRRDPVLERAFDALVNASAAPAT